MERLMSRKPILLAFLTLVSVCLIPGCDSSSLIDSDGDGIPDIYDDCPYEEGEKRFGGCPDSDGDGIADKYDACPREAGSNSNNGCPEGVANNEPSLPPSEPPSSGEVLFFDDFDGSLNPAWSAASGRWIIERDALSVQDKEDSSWLRAHVRTSNSLNWVNYTVEVDVHDAPYGAYTTASGGIIVRAEDDQNFIYFRWHKNSHMCWLVVQNGKQGDYQNCVRPALSEEAYVRIEVMEDTYKAFVRQGKTGTAIMRSTFTDDTFTRGAPGLGVRGAGEMTFDNFKVTSLP